MYDKELLKKAKDKINLLEYIEDYSNSKAKKVGHTYIVNPCPKCGHKDHFSINVSENYYQSFSNCCEGGTIIDFLKEFEKLTLDEAIEKTFRLAQVDNFQSDKESNSIKSQEGGLNKMNLNFNELIDIVHKNIGQTEYFHSRGLSDKTINKYKLGYSDEGFNLAINNSNNIKEIKNNIYKYYRYYLPILDENNNCNYFITGVDDKSVPKNLELKNKTHNLSGYEVQLFNQRYITHSDKYNNEYIFIVEGFFDALSIEELGYKSIALNSSSNAKKFITLIEKNKDKLGKKTFILIPDNDSPGEHCKDIIVTNFKRLDLNLQLCTLPESVKDANELLQINRAKLNKLLEFEVNKKKNEGFCINCMSDFIKEINEAKGKEVIKTGINSIDEAIGGGLYTGLYTIGAIPSLGKTTLVHQIADNIALQGQDVLYFSLEMGKNEIMSKSISREMFLLDKSKGATTREILTGTCDYDILLNAVERYSDRIATNIAIFEGNFKTDVNTIRKKVQRNIDLRNKKPVVIIDYLQILKPINNKMSDKQANDFNVSELKKLSRDFDIPVVVISSLNRTNYSSAIGYESFKETGAIEYGSDVIIGLQLKGIENMEKIKTESDKRNQINNLKSNNPREIEVIVLKQRNGLAYSKCDLKYYSQYNYFVD